MTYEEAIKRTIARDLANYKIRYAGEVRRMVGWINWLPYEVRLQAGVFVDALGTETLCWEHLDFEKLSRELWLLDTVPPHIEEALKPKGTHLV